MTPEDIDKLEAGRELDALIAERVMGWKWCASPNTFKPGRPWRRWLAEPYRNMPVWDGVTEMPIDGLFDEESNVLYYSTDIAAAWEVVEKLRETWPVVLVTVGPKHYDVEINTDKGSPSHYRLVEDAQAETLPLAICRAALKAISTQEKVNV